MSYYIFVEDNKLNGAGQCRCLNENIKNIEVEQSLFDRYLEDVDRYIWNGMSIVDNPQYEEIKRQKEQARINNLTMTALDFINFLKQSGLTDEMIEVYLNNNLNVKHQLQFCQNVYCGVAKQIFAEPITIGNITITADMVELAFRIKNGEVAE